MEETEKNKQGGFSYHLTDEQIDKFLKLPVSERLRWLQEAQELIFRTYTEEQWELLQKFRRGEI